MRQIAKLGELPAEVHPLVERLVEARLLFREKDFIEVAHESLLRQWPSLHSWLTEDLDKLRLLENIRRSAAEWKKEDQRNDLLVHRNGRLKDAETLLASPGYVVSADADERAYLNACTSAQQARESAEKEEQERRIRDAERIAEEQKKAAEAQKKITEKQKTIIRVVGIGLALVFLAAAAAGWQWWRAYRQGQIALARQLGAQTDLMRDQPEMLFRRLLLATEAMKRLHAVEAQSLEVDLALRRELALLPRHIERFNVEPWRQDIGRYQNVSVDLSPDGRNLIVSDSISTKVWEIETGKKLVRFEGGAEGEFIATLPGKVVRLQMAGRGDHHMPALSGDGRYVVTDADGGSERIAQVWDAKTGKQLLRLQLPAGTDDYALSADGRYLAVSFDRNTNTSSETITRVWDVQAQREIPGSAPGVVRTFSQDATVVATTRGVWEVIPELKEVFSWETDAVYNVVLTSDSRHVAIGTERGGQKQIEVWSRPAKKMTANLSTEGMDGRLQAVTPDGRSVILSDSDRDEVQVHDIAAKVIVSRAALPVRAAVVTPSGQHLIASLHEGENAVDIYELRREGGDGLAIDHEDEVVAVGLTPIGRLTTIAQNGENLIIRAWDVTTRKEMPERVAQVTGTDVVFTPDGQSFAVTGEGGLEVRRVDDPEPVAKFAYASPAAVIWSPDGRYLAAAKDRDVRVWDLSSRKPVGQVALPERPTALALARGGDSLAAVASALEPTRRLDVLHYAGLWKVATGEELTDKRQPIRSDICALSPDAQYLVTRDLKVFEMKTGTLLPMKLGLGTLKTMRTARPARSCRAPTTPRKRRPSSPRRAPARRHQQSRLRLRLKRRGQRLPLPSPRNPRLPRRRRKAIPSSPWTLKIALALGLRQCNPCPLFRRRREIGKSLLRALRVLDTGPGRARC